MADVNLNKPISKNESGVLAALWRDILKQTNSISALDLLINRYVDKTNKDKDNMSTVKRKTKSTLIANITSPEMTWKTFMDLLFNFLRVVKVSISIKLTYRNGNESVHSIVVSGTNADQDKGEEDEKGKDT